MADLLAFARHEFRLAAPHGRAGAGTLRDHLRAVERQTGRTPAGLRGPRRPAGTDALWRAFLDLHTQRGHDGGEPLPLAWRDVEAWCALRRVRLRPVDLDALRLLDREYLASRAGAAAAPDPAGGGDDDWSRD